MPLYEYECDACQQRFERIQKFTDPAPDVCAKCGKGPVQRLQSSPAFQFKGTGWYITDYARKSGGTGSDGSSKKEGSSDTSAAGSAGAAEKKTDSAPAAPSTSSAPAPKD